MAKKAKALAKDFRLDALLAAAASRMKLDLAHRLIAHPGELGTDREEVVRSFLRAYLPKRFEISTGFVFDASGLVSKQIDVIIADSLVCAHFETAGIPASASRRKPMICSSVNRFFMSNLLDGGIGLESHVLLNSGGTSRVSGLPYWEYLSEANEWGAEVIYSATDDPPPYLSEIIG